MSGIPSYITAISALAAAISVVLAFLKYKSEIQGSRRVQLQKSIVQSIFQFQSDELTFDQIKVEFRSKAADFVGNEIHRNDISDVALRNILIDLCQSNTIVQVGKDKYTLSTYLSLMRDMQLLQKELVVMQKLYFARLLDQMDITNKNIENTNRQFEESRKDTMALLSDTRNKN